MFENNPILSDIPELIENSPYIALRFIKDNDSWRACFVSKNISQLSYTPEELISGNLNWIDLVHVDDKITLTKQISDYNALKVRSFKLYYRIITKDDHSIPVTEYRTIHESPNNIYVYDSFILSNAQDVKSSQCIINISEQCLNNISLEQTILSDIFISLQDASPQKSIQLVLERTGEYLNVSRTLFYEDNPNKQASNLVYEWRNKDIKSITSLVNNVSCKENMPDAYNALQSEGMFLINSGKIPDSCKVEFELEGINGSAFFAVYIKGEYYGFICFDDCIIERVWDKQITRFLKTISNVISNILYRQASTDELEKSHKRYVSVLDNIDTYIFVTDGPTNIIIFANRAFKKIFGHDCLGMPISNFLDLDNDLLNASNVCFIDKADYPEIYCPNTKEWLNVIIENIEWIDSTQATLFTCYDITAKKHFASALEQKIEEHTRELKRMVNRSQEERRKAEEATKAKSHFLANMSHEIRTPMNAILGLSKLLSESNISELHIEYAQNIHYSSKSLLKIINDILDISKLEANKVTLINDHYSLIKLIDHVSSLVHSMADTKNLNFFLTAPNDLPECLYGDDIRLRQILVNLLSNSIKYTEKGSVELNVNVSDSTIIFSIIDTGYGIKEEEIGSIFEAFAQADAQKNRAIQSTGLGLPICRSLAKLMDATIAVQSTYGQGSTFILTIPKILGDSSKLPDEIKFVGKKLKAPEANVLVVDDIEINLFVAEALLDVYNINISTASSGAEALELIQQKPFDIVFMDHMMPEMDGVETTLAIRNLGGKFLDLTIIALTANAMSHSQALFKKASMQDFISKPIEIDKLQRILERWLPPAKIIWKES